jgi:hypothetical protein
MSNIAGLHTSSLAFNQELLKLLRRPDQEFLGNTPVHLVMDNHGRHPIPRYTHLAHTSPLCSHLVATAPAGSILWNAASEN